MVRILLAIAFGCLPTCLFAQETVLGLASRNGGGAGSLFRFQPDGSNFYLGHGFEVPLSFPEGPLLLHSNGQLYGVTERGGAGQGAIYRIQADGLGFEVIHTFGVSTEAERRPGPGLVEGANGKLFGTLEEGGIADQGGIYSISPDGSDFTIIKSFANQQEADGQHSQLILGSDGRLYGSTTGGDDPFPPQIFRIQQDGLGFENIFSFPDSINSRPYGPLLEHSNGKLYGIAGIVPAGRIYQVDPDGSNFQWIHSFSSLDILPSGGGLAEGPNQELIGFLQEGGSMQGGGVFEIQPDGSGLTILQEFSVADPTGLFAPTNRPIVAPDGKIYGVCSARGVLPGAIFRLNLDGTNLETLHVFTGQDGQFVSAPLIAGGSGMLYGVAGGGGANDEGLIYQIQSDGTNFNILQEFGGSSTGAYPEGSLILASNQQVYGMTKGGGEVGLGVVFRTDIFGSGYEVLHHFSGSDGAEPLGTLLEGMDGNLYGVTSSGGANDLGVIFRLEKDGGNFTILYEFQSNGAGNPKSGLTQLDDGTLIGVSPEQGLNQYGAIFAIQPDGGNFTILHVFDDIAVSIPAGTPLLHSNGQLYGHINQGIWKYDFAQDSLSVQLTFSGVSGSGANGDLLEGSDGSIYGMIERGGMADGGSFGPEGVIYKIQPDGSGFAVIHDFDALNGSYPSGGLTEGSDGLLYGMTTSGGGPGGPSGVGAGVIFRLEEDGSNFEVLKFLNNGIGTTPVGNLLIVPGTSALEDAPFARPGLEVFPNPTSGPLTVRIPDAAKGELRVMDLQGRIALTNRIPSGSTEVRLDLAGFASGTYVVVFMDDHGQIIRSNLLKR